MASPADVPLLVRRFDGVNIADEPVFIGPSYLQSSDNWLPNLNFQLEKRHGTVLLANVLGSSPHIAAILRTYDLLGRRYLYVVATDAFNVSRLYKSADDLNFEASLSRGPDFLVDNNGRPTVGGRMAFTFRLGESNDLTLGGSVMYGTYDPENRFTYTIAGGDLAARLGRTQIRGEYLVRHQTYLTDPATTYKLVVPANVPARQYWSATAYDRATHTLIRGVERANRASHSPGLQVSSESSVQRCFRAASVPRK